jgi:hypothetical protein
MFPDQISKRTGFKIVNNEIIQPFPEISCHTIP